MRIRITLSNRGKLPGLLTRLAAAATLTLLGGIAVAQNSPLTRDMAIHQQLGAKLPLDDTFKDETGKTVKLGDYFGKRPLVILPIFYKCQSYCAIEIDSLLKTLLKASHPTGFMGVVEKAKDHPLKLGRDLDVLMISIDPKETPELAANKKALIVQAWGETDTSDHWHLLTGSYANIRRFTDAVGFIYHYDPKTDVIRHPTCSVIATTDGHVAAYTIGYEFPKKLLQEDLAFAAQNRISAKPADQTFMFGCLMMDPSTGKIRVVVEGILRVAGVITALGMALWIWSMLRQERKAALRGLTHT